MDNRNFLNIEIPKRKTIQIGETEIAYLDIGKGTPVLALPCWPSPSLVYLPLFFALNQSFRLISIDFPGWIGKSNDPQNRTGVSFYSQLTRLFIEKLGLSNFVLTGYSYGGLVAQSVAQLCKNEIAKLVLFSSPITLEQIERIHRFQFLFLQWLQVLHVPKQLTHAMFEGMFWLGVFQRKNRLKLFDSVLLKTILQEAKHADVTQFFSSVSTSFNFVFPKMSQISIPTVSIFAEEEPLYVRDAQEIFQKHGIETIRLPATDHSHLVFDVKKSASIFSRYI